jgi:hypothetical protein
MTDLTPEERTVLRRRIDFRRQMGHERVSVTLPELTALLDAADEADRLAAERDAFIAGIGFTPAADLVELVEPLSKRIGDAVEHRQCAEELAWEKRQHEARMAKARESHERFLRDAHRVSDAYNTVARRVYRAAMKRRKTVRIADLLDGQPMVWPDGDE